MQLSRYRSFLGFQMSCQMSFKLNMKFHKVQNKQDRPILILVEKTLNVDKFHGDVTFNFMRYLFMV